MKKLLALALACQFCAVYATESAKHHLELKVSDLPKQYQHAKPGSYAIFIKKHPNFNRQVEINPSLKDDINLVYTGRSMDFALADADSYIISLGPDVLYSRLGKLMIDASGTFINNYGFPILGEHNGSPYVIGLPNVTLPPAATTLINLSGNLNYKSQDTDLYINLYLFDSIGEPHYLKMLINPVSMHTYSVSIIDANSTNINKVYAKGFIYFDKHGKLAKVEGLDKIIIPSSDSSAEPIQFEIQADSLTNFALTTRFDLQMNGYDAGELSNIYIRKDGMVVAQYSNSVDIDVDTIYTIKAKPSILTSYLPYYRVWFNKAEPHTIPTRYYGARFINGYLDKNEMSPEEFVGVK